MSDIKISNTQYEQDLWKLLRTLDWPVKLWSKKVEKQGKEGSRPGEGARMVKTNREKAEVIDQHLFWYTFSPPKKIILKLEKAKQTPQRKDSNLTWSISEDSGCKWHKLNSCQLWKKRKRMAERRVAGAPARKAGAPFRGKRTTGCGPPGLERRSNLKMNRKLQKSNLGKQ